MGRERLDHEGLRSVPDGISHRRPSKVRVAARPGYNESHGGSLVRSAWFLFAVACSGSPEIASVADPEVSGGQVVSVAGRGFGPGTVARLQAADAEAVPLVVEVTSRREMTATLPAWVRPGVYDLVVERDGVASLAPAAVTVVPPREEVACAGEYTANTELSLVRAQVVIERYYRDGDRETVTLPLETIARVEYEMTEDAQGPCS